MLLTSLKNKKIYIGRSNHDFGERFRQIKVTCDNALLVELLLADGGENSNLVVLRLLHQILRRRWRGRIHHISRIHNEVIDHMVKCYILGVSSFAIYDNPPDSVKNLPLTDLTRSMLS
ncbi:hypothetical protein J1N35_041997 [Gossypium stocksii]|uniref:RNase H type-1 domain-containing protein n=1 Tax=Gossypium stocksii TaxID=47602 RepID=A0A9D3UGX4_9ROSI|nr:hypothetical protein J1N35_041997 [Gossypium stocksii]